MGIIPALNLFQNKCFLQYPRQELFNTRPLGSPLEVLRQRLGCHCCVLISDYRSALSPVKVTPVTS